MIQHLGGLWDMDIHDIWSDAKTATNVRAVRVWLQSIQFVLNQLPNRLVPKGRKLCSSKIPLHPQNRNTIIFRKDPNGKMSHFTLFHSGMFHEFDCSKSPAPECETRALRTKESPLGLCKLSWTSTPMKIALVTTKDASDGMGCDSTGWDAICYGRRERERERDMDRWIER